MALWCDPAGLVLKLDLLVSSLPLICSPLHKGAKNECQHWKGHAFCGRLPNSYWLWSKYRNREKRSGWRSWLLLWLRVLPNSGLFKRITLGSQVECIGFYILLQNTKLSTRHCSPIFLTGEQYVIESLAYYNETPCTRLVTWKLFFDQIHQESLKSYFRTFCPFSLFALLLGPV